MWVIGGYVYGTGRDFKSDVWHSSDGANWTRATDNAPWGPRFLHQVVSYSGKMWLIGGYNYGPEGGVQSDVWSSTDGVSWTQATSNAAFGRRYRHEATVHDGRMWVVGGVRQSTLNDVWSSTDGINWTQVHANAPWSARYQHQMLSHTGKIWILGGYAPQGGGKLNDVWSSPDGIVWTQHPNAGWNKRFAHRALVFQNRAWVVGGFDGQIKNNVYSAFGGLNAYIQVPASDFPAFDSVTTNLEATGTWNSRQTLSGVIADVEFSLRIAESASGIPGESQTINISLHNNRPPTLNNLTVYPDIPNQPKERFVSIVADIADEDSDLMSVSNMLYSLDGTTWVTPTAVNGNAVDLQDGVLKLNWLSHLDIPATESTVSFRFTLSDGKEEVVGTRSDFSVDNTSKPATWLTQKAPTSACDNAESAELNSQIYIFCGGSSNPLGSVFIYDAITGISSAGKDQVIDRFAHTAVSLLGKIYLWGGRQGSTVLNDLEIHEPENNVDPRLSGTGGTARSNHAAAAVDGKIYYFGGLDSSTSITSIDVYDAINSTWLQPLDTAPASGLTRSEHTATAYNGKIYLIGGVTGNTFGQSIMDIYSVATNSWTTAPGVARYGHSAVVIDGQIIVWGGSLAKVGSTLHTIAIYDVETGIWTEEDWSTPPPGELQREGRYQATSAVFNGRMFVWGGQLSDSPNTVGPAVTLMESYRPTTTQKTLASFNRAEGVSVEGDFLITVDVSLNKPAAVSGSVNYSLSPLSTAQEGAGNDFTFTDGTLSFSAGQQTKSFTFNVQDDSSGGEGREIIHIILDNPVGIDLGDIPEMTFTIVDDD